MFIAKAILMGSIWLNSFPSKSWRTMIRNISTLNNIRNQSGYPRLHTSKITKEFPIAPRIRKIGFRVGFRKALQMRMTTRDSRRIQKKLIISTTISILTILSKADTFSCSLHIPFH